MNVRRPDRAAKERTHAHMALDVVREQTSVYDARW